MAQFKADAYGTKPTVPAFTPVDASKAQTENIESALANVSKAGELARRVGEEQQKSRQALLGEGYRTQMETAQGAIDDQLNARVHQQVLDQISDRAAARGMSLGLGGGGAQQGIELRDLGVNAMQYVQQGLDNLQNFWQLKGQMEMPETMQISSMFLSPTARLQHQEQERTSLFNRNLYASEIAAAPEPSARAAEELRVMQSMADMNRRMMPTFSGGGSFASRWGIQSSEPLSLGYSMGSTTGNI